MNIQRVLIEITPPNFADRKVFTECRVEVIVDDYRFAHIWVLERDDFESAFSRYIDYAKHRLLEAVKQHDDKNTKGRGPRKGG